MIASFRDGGCLITLVGLFFVFATGSSAAIPVLALGLIMLFIGLLSDAD
jgi:hypothetical protein